jgi:hypothetical protein
MAMRPASPAGGRTGIEDEAEYNRGVVLVREGVASGFSADTVADLRRAREQATPD